MPTVTQRSGPTIVDTTSRPVLPSRMADNGPTANGKPAARRAPGPQHAKKTKGKKPEEPIDHAKLVAQAISQIESKQAGDREQDLEIEREVKKTMRETNNELNKSFEDNTKKFEALNEKYRELLFNLKRLDRDHRTYKRKAEQSQKERDSAKSEITKLTTKNTRLESLSKELQRQNKDLKTSLKQVQDEETLKRIDLHDRIEHLSRDMTDIINSKEHAQSHSETFNTDKQFREKFKSFVDQYELRELHFSSLLRSKDLELQYHIAKLEQHRRDKEMESNKSHQLTRQVSNFSQTESELRSQLNIYVEKFKQVEDTLNSSNDLFLTFRKEMEEMSKKTKRLEKENAGLTRKHEATNQSIIKMAEERTRHQKEIEMLRKKNTNLEKLCRGMQAQGRGQPQLPPPQTSETAGHDEEGTESEYDYSDEDDEDDGSLEDEDYEESSGSIESPTKVTMTPATVANGLPVRTKNQAIVGNTNGIKA